jgi:cellulose 1,4-beta-cellobiosidase
VLGTVTSNSVALSWSGSTDNVGVTGYYVYRNGTQVASVTATSYTDTGLSGNTQYSYVVKAHDAAGNVSPASNTVTATTSCSGDCTPPTAPTLSVGTITSSSIALSWSGSTDNVGVTGYYVYRNGTQVASVTTTSYTDTSLAASTQYSYTVKAYDAAGNLSPASNTVMATTSTPGVSCHISYSIQSSWGTGFDAAINITNTGSTAISSWTLTWTWSGNQQLTQANGSTGSQSGQNVTLTSLSWDGSIAAGATLSGDVSIAASYSGTNNNPTTFYLNGSQCQ